MTLTQIILVLVIVILVLTILSFLGADFANNAVELARHKAH